MKEAYFDGFLVMVSDDNKGWTEYAVMPTSPDLAFVRRVSGKQFVHITPIRLFA